MRWIPELRSRMTQWGRDFEDDDFGEDDGVGGNVILSFAKDPVNNDSMFYWIPLSLE